MPKKFKISWTGVVVFLAVLLNGFFLTQELNKYYFNFSALFRFGDVFVDNTVIPGQFLVFENTEGYDGQFYYGLAHNPFTKNSWVGGVKLDDPPYRQQRLLFPTIARFFSQGDPRLLPYIFVAINMLCVALVAYLGARFAEHFNKPAVFGLILALYPGFLFTLSRNVVELLEITFLLGALLALEKKRTYLVGILFGLAVLARETAVIVVLGIAVYLFIKRLFKSEKVSFVPVIIPISVYVIVRGWIFRTWGNFGTEISGHIDMPFVGLFNFIDSVIPSPSHMETAYLVSVVYFLVFVGVVLGVIVNSLRNSYVSDKTSSFLNNIKHLITKNEDLIYVFAWLPSLALAVSYSYFIWREDPGYLRALTELFILGFIIVLKSRSKAIYFVFLINVFVWVYLAIHLVLWR